MTREQIQQAFDALLLTVTNGGDVRIEDGSIYTPKQGRPYLFGRLSSYTATPLGIGPSTPYQHAGSYAVAVMRPSVEGRAAAGAMAALIAGLMPRGLSLGVGTNGEFVQVFNSAPTLLVTQSDWMNLPVVVSFLGSDL